MEKTQRKTKDITKIAILAAMIYLGTYFIKIPSPNGYAHLGDCMIFVSVLILGYKKGALAGAIGASLSDFLGGYMQWVVPTFFIKGIMAIIMGIIAEKLFPKFKYGWLVGATIGGIFQIVAYTLVKIPLFGYAYAIARIPGITIQTIMGIIFALVIITALSKTNLLEKLKEM
ncbi:MAG: ECF transporter S component [Clostridiales bacterium]|nr:ECF transporter S component [Clostridiales bacterium]